MSMTRKEAFEMVQKALHKSLAKLPAITEVTEEYDGLTFRAKVGPGEICYAVKIDLHCYGTFIK